MERMFDYITILIFFGLLIIAGCSQTKVIEVVDPMYERNNPSFLKEFRRSDNAESCYNLILNNYRSNTRSGFQDSMRHANFFNQHWPDHRNNVYANYYAAWSSMYLVEGPDIASIDTFNQYDQYITRFYQAQLYARNILSSAGSGNEMAFEAGRELITLTEEGRANSRLLNKFLEARHTMDIQAYSQRDESLFRDALKQFKKLRKRYPRWLPGVVQKQIEELDKIVE